MAIKSVGLHKHNDIITAKQSQPVCKNFTVLLSKQHVILAFFTACEKNIFGCSLR